MEYVAEHQGSYDSPWLTHVFGQWLWTNRLSLVYRFPSEEEAVRQGQRSLEEWAVRNDLQSLLADGMIVVIAVPYESVSTDPRVRF